MKSFNFKQCTLLLLDKMFALEQTENSNVLDQWLDRRENEAVTDFEKMNIERLQKNMKRNIYSWNEQELALHFIGPFISHVTFSSKKFNIFAERLLDATLQDVDGEEVSLSGKPDTFVASGFRAPEVPFFSFHEHKTEVDSSGDPIGQVLASMLVGQAKNDNLEEPIYGCYVIGQNWYFLVLENKNYTIASPFATTNEEVFDVFKVLKAMKTIIEERIQ